VGRHRCREYGLGRRALGLDDPLGAAQDAIEGQLRRDARPEGDALDQVARISTSAGLEEGFLVMFDLRAR